MIQKYFIRMQKLCVVNEPFRRASITVELPDIYKNDTSPHPIDVSVTGKPLNYPNSKKVNYVFNLHLCTCNEKGLHHTFSCLVLKFDSTIFFTLPVPFCVITGI